MCIKLIKIDALSYLRIDYSQTPPRTIGTCISFSRRYAPKEHLMHLEGERGEEWCQGQHETTDYRRKPCIATTTRADDQRRRTAGNRGAQRPRPHWNVYPIVTLDNH